MTFRQLKQQVLAVLQSQPLEEGLAAIAALPARQVINPLFSLLCHDQEIVRWHAVSAFGEVVGRLAEQNIESARVIMRRLMWNLNDESGGIGWGSPEAMGEIMARHAPLAREYGAILVSYLNPEGNYLEHEGLQQGVLWAVGRLARVRPLCIANAAPFFSAFFSARPPPLRGLAIWAGIPIFRVAQHLMIEPLRRDPARFSLYWDGRITELSVAEVVIAALTGLTTNEPHILVNREITVR